MVDSISLSLSYSSGPGMQWDYAVRIEATQSGHRVVAIDPISGQMRTVRRSRKALTWRIALVDLFEIEETWLRGDLRNEVDIGGVAGWQADMLRLAVCRIEDDRSHEAELLSKLSDRAIERFAKCWGPLVAKPALAMASSLAEVYADTGTIAVIEDHVLRTARADVAAPEAWLDRVRAACEESPGPGPSMAAARSVQDAESFLALAAGPPPRSSAVRALLFLKWAELVLPTTFDRSCGRLGDQPELVAVEWVISACAKPGEIAAAAESDPALKAAVARFCAAVDEFVQSVSEMPKATSYAGGISWLVKRKAAATAVKVRNRVLGDHGGPGFGVALDE